MNHYGSHRRASRGASEQCAPAETRTCCNNTRTRGRRPPPRRRNRRRARRELEFGSEAPAPAFDPLGVSSASAAAPEEPVKDLTAGEAVKLLGFGLAAGAIAAFGFDIIRSA